MTPVTHAFITKCGTSALSPGHPWLCDLRRYEKMNEALDSTGLCIVERGEEFAQLETVD